MIVALQEDVKEAEKSRGRIGEGKMHAKVQPAPTKSPRILLGEDDFEMRRFLASVLRRDGYEVTEAADGVQVLDSLGGYVFDGMRFDFDVVISDIRMPGIDGLDILAGLRLCNAAPPVILITAFGNSETHVDARRLGAVTVLDKPFDIDDLRTAVRGAIRKDPDAESGLSVRPGGVER